MGVLFGLLAALAYGSGDFAAGVASRRLAAGPVTTVTQAVGLLAAGLAVLIFPGVGPTATALGWGAVSGIGAGVGTLSLYQGLSTARMSVVAPVSAVLTAVLPVVVGLLLGERPTILATVGIVAAVVAIGLVSRGQADTEPHAHTAGPDSTVHADAAQARVALGWGTLAGAGFALLFIALDQAGTDSGAWPLVPSQVVSLILVLPFGWATRPRREQWRTALVAVIVAGIAGGGANLLFLTATGHGQLALVAVITALYPAVTVILARAILAEHWTRLQAVGLATAGAAVVMTTLN